MKRFTTFLLLAAMTVATLGSCNREKEDSPDVPVVYSSIAVNIGDAGESGFSDEETRSLLSIESENFVCAYLFAFYSDNGKILTYGDGYQSFDAKPGDPVTKYTSSKNFSWDLPVGGSRKFDIWVVVNPGEEYEDFLEDAAKNPNLTKNDLYGDKMMFHCASGNIFKKLDVESSGSGIPMSGRVTDMLLKSADEGISIKVSRLFAKYDIRFDVAEYKKLGYDVEFLTILGSGTNTEVPFFYDGDYCQTDYSKIRTSYLDHGTDNDLMMLNEGEFVSLYFLENCHGNKSGVNGWNTVYQDLILNDSDIVNCSYIEVNVNLRRDADSDHHAVNNTFIHRIYVGETFFDKQNHTYNFDVKRNLYQSVSIKLGPDVKPTSGVFLFMDMDDLKLEPSETKEFQWVANGIPYSDLIFETNDEGLSITDPTYHNSPYVYQGVTFDSYGTVKVKADDYIESMDGLITGGANLGKENEVSDVKQIDVHNPYDFAIDWDIWRGSSTMRINQKVNPRSWISRYRDGVFDWSQSSPVSNPDANRSYWFSNDDARPWLYLGYQHWSVVSGENVIIGNDGTDYITATQPTTAVVKCDYVAPNGKTYEGFLTINFENEKVYELRIITNEEDSGFYPGQPESVAGSAQVNGYIELRAYMYTVINGQDLKRENVTESAEWSAFDQIYGEEDSDITISRSGSGASASVRIRSTKAVDRLIHVCYPFNNSGYSNLYEDIPVTFSSNGGTGGGGSQYTEHTITFELLQNNQGRWYAVASEAVPCNVYVRGGNPEKVWQISEGSQSSSAQVQSGTPSITSVTCASTGNNYYISGNTKYIFTF